jgi:anti-sigma regulatory factor (Ser/Thr protein kinase)
MELPTTKTKTSARMWHIYAGVWLAYTILLAFADQLDNLRSGHLSWSHALYSCMSLVPAALSLALLWPLSGRLEGHRWRPPTLLAIHAGLALVYGACSLGTITLVFGIQPGRTLGWYVWPFLYNAMTYCITAAIFHTIRASAAAHRHALAMHEANNLLIASELSALRSKLNPHFLFNTLHSIIALTRKNPGAAETALFKFSDMLRYVLNNEKSGIDRVTLEDELHFVRDYLDLELLRLGARLQVEWDLDDAANGATLPALTLQPLVENSIKHAFNPHVRPGHLLIRTRLDAQAQRLRMTVRDNGPGADPARLHQSNGLGIRTVERRLLLDYDARAEFRIQTKPGDGFDVSLSIPLDALEA